MPTYNYRCTMCATEFETEQRITEAPLNDCPSCDGSVIRLIGKNVSIAFKGTGFYVTDHKK